VRFREEKEQKKTLLSVSFFHLELVFAIVTIFINKLAFSNKSWHNMKNSRMK
jgi:hypothetical protein